MISHAVFGASGFGREVMPLVRDNLAHGALVFVDDSPQAEVINGQQVLTYSQWLAEPATERRVTLAIGSGVVREALARRCANDRVEPFEVRARNVMIMDDVVIGVGSILCPFVTITSNVRIGCHFHANLYSYVAHDCVIGDFVTLAPGVMCNGNVVIEDHVYVGAGAVLKHGRPGAPLVVGRAAVIGMGAVVTRDVPPGVTMVGNPARPLAPRV